MSNWQDKAEGRWWIVGVIVFFVIPLILLAVTA